ncbi:hypothetical protein KC19_12G084200 [Ceratodon purpureus]|uniref:Uncharacterized protein n=1 Tax=Ceratodon purpureus TaxID=3225 RepID=A0A8T0G5K1_CERPU|nr:hypothetical protein KC19_12G083700 [Ceratodon purpureus]KAG0554353.1 hypothetical protein KC19_12G084200 [Ceratodon purpureus]
MTTRTLHPCFILEKSLKPSYIVAKMTLEHLQSQGDFCLYTALPTVADDGDEGSIVHIAKSLAGSSVKNTQRPPTVEWSYAQNIASQPLQLASIC